MHAEPPEANGPSGDAQDDKNIRSPGAEVGEGAEEEEEDDLNGKGDAVAEEDDGVDGAVMACKMQNARVAGFLVEQVLECSGRKVEE